MKKATKLEDLRLTSVDFCKVGANQEALILLKKSVAEGSKTMEEGWKEFTEKAAKSMEESFTSIMEDGTLEKAQKTQMLRKSMNEFFDTAKEFSETVAKNMSEQKKQTAIDTEKSVSATKRPELHPEVKKALEEAEILKAELEEMKKSVEIGKMELVAKKYEVIGKKPEELAPKLYEMKKSGGTAFNDYVTLLDEQVEMVEKSGIFKEVGSNRSGGGNAEMQLEMRIKDLRKADSALTYEQAFVRACDEDPELKKAVE